MKENIINYVPLKIYRRLRWEKEQSKKYKQTKSVFGEEYAQLCYAAEKAIYQDHPVNEVLTLLKQRDDYILRKIEQTCARVIQKSETYSGKPVMQRDVDEPIWVFWWDGEENAPEIVKACIRSIRRNTNGHRVVFLSRENMGDYVDLPEYIERKHENGIIGHAHYADMVRLALLAKYGGVWIDATVFVSQPLPEELFKEEFYTAKSIDNKAFYFSKSRWVGYFLAGNREFPLFAFSRDMLFEYWMNEEEAISYLIMDYIFYIAYRCIPEVHVEMDRLPDNNLARGQLMSRINEPYSPDIFDELERGNTFISKLSWRYGNPIPVTEDGKTTNYGHILEL